MNETIRIGLMPPLTGVVGLYGTEISRAGKIACAEINEAGGVLGRRIELVIEDDGSLPDTSVAAANRLVDQHGCCAIIGNLLSNSRIAVAYQVAEPKRIPYLNFSFYEGSILSRYFFHFAALPNQQIDKMIPFMCDRFGRRMFFAGLNYEWPRGSIDAAKRALLEAGGKVVGEEYCPFGASAEAIEQLLDAVAAAAPDVFVPYFAGDDQLRLLTRFTERGLKQRMAVVMGHYDEMMASHLPPQVRSGFYSSNSYFMSVDTPQNRAYLARLAALPGVNGIWPNGDGILTNFGEGAYLCVKAFALAAERAGSVEAEALVDALASIELAGPQGTVRMDPATHHAHVNNYLACCQDDGSFAIIEQFKSIAPLLPERYRHLRPSVTAAPDQDVRLQARMLAQMSEGVLLVSNDTASIVYANTGAGRMFGYEQDELLGKPLAELVDANGRGAIRDVRQVFDEIMRHGHWEGELRYRRKDGDSGWGGVSVSAFTHPELGEVWMWVQKDISELKSLQDELQRHKENLEQLVAERTLALSVSEEKYRNLFTNMVEEVHFWQLERDAAGNIETWRLVDANPPALKTWGRKSIEEIRGKTTDEIFGPGATEHYLPVVQKIFTEGKPYSFEDFFPNLDKHFRFTSVPLGESFITTGADITGIKKSQIMLREAKEAADVASQAKSEFLANMSHEIRTPLNAVIGLARIALRENMGRSAELTCGRILKSSNHLLDVINGILDYSKIEAGKLDVETIPIRLPGLIDEIMTLVGDAASQKGLVLTGCPGAGLPEWVSGDPIRIRQILVNLLSNAIKFTEHGRITLTITAAGGDIRFAVRDEGIGMTAEEIANLFKPFEQGDKSITRKFGGTGLGLAISQHLARLMGGAIDVVSTPGEGSTFTLALPLAETCAPVQAVPEERPAPAGQPLAGLHLLAAEDVAVNRLILEDTLEHAGASFEIVENGLEAVERVRAQPGAYDAVLMDVQMPVMDGHDATRRIKAIAPGLPVIALTAHALVEEREKGRAAGMVGQICKPFEPEDLVGEVLKWVHA